MRRGEATTVRVPGDKSMTHRGLLFAALAHGRSRLRGVLDGADTRATAAALRQLGRAVPGLGPGELVMDGAGLHGLQEAAGDIDCGNSGTTARLLMGALAGHPFSTTLTGDASLRSRPMRRVLRPLAAMGAHFDELAEPDRLPVRIRGGTLRGIHHDSPHASAQVKSAILLAGLTGGVSVSVAEPVPSRDHSERMLADLGVPLARTLGADGSARVQLTPVERLAPLDCVVPGDFSSAAFVIAYACLGAAAPVHVPGVGVNPTRTGMLRVLSRMGAMVYTGNERTACGEPVADLVIERAPLHATSIAAAEVPSLVDEIPVIAVLAARAEGTTVIEGAAELRVKESDRIAAVVTNLRAIGARAEELPDGMIVHGTGRPFAGRVQAFHDHRIAMAFGVLAALEHGRVHIDGADVVGVSFPGFWSMLQHLGR
jgi:3-phosphoshikimate 1-carboxyvinyltransferase